MAKDPGHDHKDSKALFKDFPEWGGYHLFRSAQGLHIGKQERKKKKNEQVDSLNIEFLSCLTERCYLLSFIQTINYLAKCCPNCGVIAMN